MGFEAGSPTRKGLWAGAAFLGVGVAWLLVSDRWAAGLGLDPEGLLRFRRVEAGVLVLATAGAVAWVVRRLLAEEARRRDEAERREARYRMLFEAAPVALWEEDATALLDRMADLGARGPDLGARLREDPRLLADLAARVRVLDVNRRTLELYGARTKEDLLGSLGRVLTPSGLTAFGEAVIALAGGRTEFEVEAENRTLDGRPLRVHLRFWVSTSGPDRGRALVSATDLTELHRTREERERLEGRLRETERLEALGRFAAGIAHDFNNLHMVIQGNAELGLLEQGLPDRARKGLERIVAASGRAADLVAKLLAYSGVQRAEPEAVDLGGVAAGVLEDLEELVPEGVGVELDARPGAPAAWIDPGQARIVVQNLVTNAVEAVAAEGGRVTVRTAALDDPAGWFGQAEGEPPAPGRRYVLLEVADTGPGMDGETRRRAFDPFFTTKFLGRGLGLSVVWGVVRAVGGAVRIDSAPGRGTRVGVALPASPRA